ncbi:MAG: cell envelope integrity EipB family protein [Acetobacteraceae bacterium]
MRFVAALASWLLLAPALVPAAFASNNAPAPTLLQTASRLAAHKALYQLTLDRVRGSEITGASGTMGYEVVDACDGWAVRQRLQMTITNSDGQDIQMVSDYTTWESKDGLKFRFHMRQTTDTAVTSQTGGTATLRRLGGPGEARYTVPKEMRIDLPAGTEFPMMHTAAIILAAKEGKKFITLPLFDGTDAEGVEDSSVAIIDWKPPFKTDYPALSSLSSTRVRLAFFDRKASVTTPSYEVGMRYWENGVADDLQMDFGDFVMKAKMTQFDQQPRRC